MKTKVTNSDLKRQEITKNEDREGITLTVFAVFFVIALGLLMLSQV